jgi:hypothetical protein
MIDQVTLYAANVIRTVIPAPMDPRLSTAYHVIP